MNTQELKDVVRQTRDELLSNAEVQSVGVGLDDNDEPTLVVGVRDETALSASDVNQLVRPLGSDVPYEVREVGEFSAEIVEPEADPTGRFRPVVHGVSCGHPNVTAGTIGLLYEDADGNQYLGSNNHVLANINQASVGDAMLQPGTADGGATPDDTIGSLAYYTPLADGVSVDLAVGEVAGVNVDNVVNDMSQPLIGSTTVSLNDEVVKSGRTTGVTRGTVDQVGVSVDVDYGTDVYTISDTIITTDMSSGGDSGSPMFIEGSTGLSVAGRLFAGSSSATVFHDFQNELAALQNNFDSTISLVTEEVTTTPTATVQLTLESTATDLGNIRAEVSDTAGDPLQNATVTISGDASGSMETNSNGVALFTDVPIGSYTVEATKPDYTTDSATVSSGDFV